MDNKKNMRLSNKGFTLVEMIIACCLLVVGIVPIMSSFIVSRNMSMKGRQKEQAMTVAQNIVETVKALGAVTTYDLVSANTEDCVGSGSVALDGELSEAVKSRTVSINGVDTSIGWTDYSYSFIVDDYIMGSSKYDAKVSVVLDDKEDTNIIAYKYSSDYGELKLPIQKYFNVYVEVSFDGQTEILAKYSGSFVTKN